jgi:hypothetical protein
VMLPPFLSGALRETWTSMYARLDTLISRDRLLRSRGPARRCSVPPNGSKALKE